ncbi:uncharacterized protein LOC103186887 [Callorhinchus milii]|uniref:uncharacterized protein LOC103186887 n=1 Tax=Callorhinchus milii TaxID=7868 RepID=UPI001C3F8C9F|nr:uncharacterized protein LOC103186887 [Callorhinchus milii]
MGTKTDTLGWPCPGIFIVTIVFGSLVTVADTKLVDGFLSGEQAICAGNNSTLLESELDSGNIKDFCKFTVTKYACAQPPLLAKLTPENLTLILHCFVVTRPVGSSEQNATILFIQKLSQQELEDALERLNGKINDTARIPLEAKEAFLTALCERWKFDINFKNVTFLENLFQLFRPFIAGISQPILESFHSQNMSCESFQAVVHGFNASLSEMPATTKSIVETWIFRSIDVIGADCFTKSSGSRDWLLKNWGLISDLIWKENFTDSYMNSTEVVVPIVQNDVVRDTILSGIFQQLTPLFQTFTPLDFTDWFQVKLPPLLPSIKSDELANIPTNITCESYQAIVKGLSSVHLNLTVTQSLDIFNFGKNFLSFQLKSSDSHSAACTTNTNGSREWVLKNFVGFMAEFSIRDLLALNKNFSGELIGSIPCLQ